VPQDNSPDESAPGRSNAADAISQLLGGINSDKQRELMDMAKSFIKKIN